MKESRIQLQILHYLKKSGYATMQELSRYKELGCVLPAVKGVYGRVNTMAVPVVVRGRIKAYRKNPYIFLGMPDIMGFRTSEKDDGFVTPFAIECKQGDEVLRTAQGIFKDYAVRAGYIYILARDLDDVTGVL